MPRTESKVQVNNFVGGLVSDFHELNVPDNTTVDEDNCDLDRKGFRKRRLGIDFETDHAASSGTTTLEDWPSLYVGKSKWLAVAKDGNRNFLVVQRGEVLSFYDLAVSTLSDAEKSFTVDLSDFAIAGATDLASLPVQTAYGKGLLFVVGEAIDPFFITYDPDTDTITTTETVLKIRDLELQDHDLAYTEQPTTLTAAQKYDFYNQGWWSYCTASNDHQDPAGGRQVFDWYFSQRHKYPMKAKSWWLGKRIGVSSGQTIFDAKEYDTAYTGNMLAPLGTYILEAFNQDRSGASGIEGLPVVVDSTRPTAVAFYSGRVFYGHNNKIYFSQLLNDDLNVAGYCYQEADPTAENINDLIATDGGVVTIDNAGTIFAMVAYENSLFVFATNGVWAVGGSSVGSGFSATDFSIYKITEAGALSARSIVSVEGLPYWWSKLGIYAIVSEPNKQGYSAQNVTLKKLQNFYTEIPPLSKIYATGDYDQTKKVITWIYNSTDDVIGNNPYVCDKLLNYDLLYKAFYPYSLTVNSTLPTIVDVFSVLDIVATVENEVVLTNAGTTVRDSANAAVTVENIVYGNSANTISSLKFLTFYRTV